MNRKTSIQTKLGVLLTCLLLAGGCSSFPGTSFKRQVEEFNWSVSAMVGTPGWQENLLWDLEVLGDPEWGELGNSFTMLGW